MDEDEILTNVLAEVRLLHNQISYISDMNDSIHNNLKDMSNKLNSIFGSESQHHLKNFILQHGNCRLLRDKCKTENPLKIYYGCHTGFKFDYHTFHTFLESSECLCGKCFY